ncbi:bifunctional oligoribonuclease/PAP phosphatase NrnA [Candidatus Gracilibacteria bacterium]|nr:bifunctional oligoribonuclease/PAP phosphatase NrnA [Candidatus Gracilibacteria bacterium]
MTKIEKILEIGKLIKDAQKILIISHKHPDGDTLGAGTAWFEYLKSIGKYVEIACDSDVPILLQFIPNSEFVQRDFDLEKFDLVIINDAGAKQIAGFIDTKPELYEKRVPTINIDHHASNDMYGTVNLVELVPSATCLIYEIFEELGYKISPNTATSLLTGIYTDTGSFKHSNTNSYALRIASKLMSKGANLKKITKNCFQTTKIETMKLWGRVLSNIFRNEEGITTSVVKQEDFDETGTKYEDLSGVVDYLNSVPGSEYSILLTEREGKIKGSLRTENNIDLTEIAGKFGGGGHKKASGFTIPGRLQKEVVRKVIE